MLGYWNNGGDYWGHEGEYEMQNFFPQPGPGPYENGYNAGISDAVNDYDNGLACRKLVSPSLDIHCPWAVSA